MKYAIHVDERDDKSDHRRGYHNYDATVRFEYADPDARFTEEREAEMVKDLLAKSGRMWYSAVKNPTLRVWEVNHGYDSGD